MRTSQKRPSSPMPRIGQSPPNRDPGPRQLEGGKQAPLSQEIRKLQNELEVYIQKVEELANRGDPQKERVTFGPCLTVDYMSKRTAYLERFIVVLVPTTIFLYGFTLHTQS